MRKAGVSNIYLRLLRGEVTPARYVAVITRAAAMRLRLEHRGPDSATDDPS